jgi:hypothetical protein
MFVGQIYFGAFRHNEGKADSPGTRALALHESALSARKNELADRTSLRSGLLFQLPIEGGRNVNSRANGFLLHELSIAHMP